MGGKGTWEHCWREVDSGGEIGAERHLYNSCEYLCKEWCFNKIKFKCMYFILKYGYFILNAYTSII